MLTVAEGSGHGAEDRTYDNLGPCAVVANLVPSSCEPSPSRSVSLSLSLRLSVCLSVRPLLVRFFSLILIKAGKTNVYYHPDQSDSDRSGLVVNIGHS